MDHSHNCAKPTHMHAGYTHVYYLIRRSETGGVSHQLIQSHDVCLCHVTTPQSASHTACVEGGRGGRSLIDSE